MCRHVIGSFNRMDIERVAFRHEPREKFFQITPHIRIGILLDQERSGGVAKMKREQALFEPAFDNPGRNLIGDFIQTLAACVHLESMDAIEHA